MIWDSWLAPASRGEHRLLLACHSILRRYAFLTRTGLSISRSRSRFGCLVQPQAAVLGKYGCEKLSVARPLEDDTPALDHKLTAIACLGVSRRKVLIDRKIGCEPAGRDGSGTGRATRCNRKNHDRHQPHRRLTANRMSRSGRQSNVRFHPWRPLAAETDRAAQRWP